MLTLVFELDGFAVLSANGGTDGFGLIQHHRPDLVLLDSRMPRGSGPELIRAAQSTPGLEQTRFLMMSALEPDADLDVAWVKKPFEVEALLERIRVILNEESISTEAERRKASGT